MHFLQAINSGLSVLIACNKTGGTIKGDIKKILVIYFVRSLEEKKPEKPCPSTLYEIDRKDITFGIIFTFFVNTFYRT
jgi:hypothetical protein